MVTKECTVHNCPDPVSNKYTDYCSFHLDGKGFVKDIQSPKLVHFMIDLFKWPRKVSPTRNLKALASFLKSHRELQGQTVTASQLKFMMGPTCPYKSGEKWSHLAIVRLTKAFMTEMFHA